MKLLIEYQYAVDINIGSRCRSSVTLPAAGGGVDSGRWTHCVNIGWGHGGRRRNRLVLKVSKICALIFTILREGTFYCKQVFKLAWLSIKIIGR